MANSAFDQIDMREEEIRRAQEEDRLRLERQEDERKLREDRERDIRNAEGQKIETKQQNDHDAEKKRHKRTPTIALAAKSHAEDPFAQAHAADVGSVFPNEPAMETEPTEERVKTPRRSRVMPVAVGLSLVLGLVGVGLGATALSQQDGFKSIVATAFDDVDARLEDMAVALAGAEQDRDSLASRIDGNTRQIKAIGIDDVNATIDSIEQQVADISLAMASTAKSDDINPLLKEYEDLKSTVDGLRKQVSAKPKQVTRSTVTPAKSSGPVLATEIGDLHLVQIDFWAGQPNAVLIDPDGRFVNLKPGDVTDGWTFSGVDSTSSHAKFTNGQLIRLLVKRSS